MNLKPSNKRQRIKVRNQNNHQVVILPHFEFTQQIDQLLQHLKKSVSQKTFKPQQSNNLIPLEIQEETFGQIIKQERPSKQKEKSSEQKERSPESTINLNKSLSILFSHYNFYNLEYLCLEWRSLTNCQFLIFVDMPRLTMLFLQGNYIHNFKPLNRSNLPCLEVLNIDSNALSQLNIQRCKFSQKQYFRFVLDKSYEEKTQIQDISFMAKLQLSKQSQLCIYKDIIKKLGQLKILHRKINYVLYQYWNDPQQ